MPIYIYRINVANIYAVSLKSGEYLKKFIPFSRVKEKNYERHVP